MKILYKAGLCILCCWLVMILSCSDNDSKESYFGRLEADTVQLSAAISGELVSVFIRQGESFEEGDLLGQIDTEAQEIQKRQLLAKQEALEQNLQSALLQIDQAEVQLEQTRENLDRTERLLQQGGSTRQRRDELATAFNVGQSNLEILKGNYRMLLAQKEELQAGVDLLDLSLSKASITAPFDGVLLRRYFNRGELVPQGRPVFEIADLDEMKCYIYVPLNHLPEMSLGREARIYITGSNDVFTGRVERIAPEAEFTPKTILTEDTRDTLVYEVSIGVANPSGILKIGMPVDVLFQ